MVLHQIIQSNILLTIYSSTQLVAASIITFILVHSINSSYLRSSKNHSSLTIHYLYNHTYL